MAMDDEPVRKFLRGWGKAKHLRLLSDAQRIMLNRAATLGIPDSELVKMHGTLSPLEI